MVARCEEGEVRIPDGLIPDRMGEQSPPWRHVGHDGL